MTRMVSNNKCYFAPDRTDDYSKSPVVPRHRQTHQWSLGISGYLGSKEKKSGGSEVRYRTLPYKVYTT